MRLYATIYLFAYVLLLITMFVLPFFYLEEHSVTLNTISELGAQKVPGNWLINATIIIVSLAIVILATNRLKLYWKQLIVLYFFCMSFLLTGVYKLAGTDTYTHIFNYTHDALHSLFTVLTGFGFCLFCISFIFIVEKKIHKWQTFMACIFALTVPLLMWRYPEYKGIFQRILFLGSFGWLFYALTTYTFKSARNPVSGMKRYKKPRKHIYTNEK